MAANLNTSNEARFVNKNMLVCKASFNTYEEIAEALHREGYWKAVSRLQRLDYNHHYGVEIKDKELREKLFKNGLLVGNYKLSFVYHGTNGIRVHILHLPLGISYWEISDFFAIYGKVDSSYDVTETLHGRKVCTGERYGVTFLGLSS